MGGIGMAKAKTGSEKPSKTQLVIDAIAALGGDPGPKQIQEYIKQNHNVDLKYALVASYKSNLKNKKGGAARRNVSSSGSVDLKDLQAVKELLNRLGESQLQNVIKALR
jgi:hypothetical protein